MEHKENKLVIFDLDGVLMDSREMHFEALNSALKMVAGEEYLISKEEHLSLYDGLPTRRKLQMLHEKKGLPTALFDDIAKMKQVSTIDYLHNHVEVDKELVEIFETLKYNLGFSIGVASNSVRSTLKVALFRLGIINEVDYWVSNEDVKHNKPYPEMYWQIMTVCKTLPRNCVIIEDSHIGRQGALDSGATLLPVENRADLTKDKVGEIVDVLTNGKKPKRIPWRSKKMNVLIPMAGAGSRFAAAGYTFPKPLIEIKGKPMIQVVVENLNIDAHYIFIVQKEHNEKYNLKQMLNVIAPGCDVILTDGVTGGAALSTLLARSLIDNDSPLVIANSDQFVEWNSNEVLYAFTADGVDGGILTFDSFHPKWSYASLDENGFVKEVAEKKVISNHATVGIYYWKKGSDYVNAVSNMVAAGDKTNGEFYVAPAFNYAIDLGLKIRVKDIPAMHGLGTPEDLQEFLLHYGDKL
jgi:HAD superfamily hydrolase (TIGR01509 family)